MKVTIVPFQKNWADEFQQIAAYLLPFLKELDPTIVHIGSTAVHGLAAKPIIDIIIGLPQHITVDKAINPMLDAGAVYYEKYNEIMPYRRFFTLSEENFEKGSSAFVLKNKVNIHILTYKSEHWIRHIAFRDYLRHNDNVRIAYEKLKIELSKQEFQDLMEYNKAKDFFIKKHELLALEWYNQK